MILKTGSRGEDVRKLQLGLAYLGYHPGIADGKYGSGTENAVEAFQKAHKLFSDGEAGPSTLTAYNAALTASGEQGDPHLITWSTLKTSDSETKPLKPTGGLGKLTRPFWPRCPADQFGEGQGNKGTVLRSDVAPQL